MSDSKTYAAQLEILKGSELGLLVYDFKLKLDAAWSYDGQIGAHDNPSGAMMSKSSVLWSASDEAWGKLVEYVSKHE